MARLSRTTKTTAPSAAVNGNGTRAAAAAAPVLAGSPTRRRSRPALFALAAALAVVGTLVGMWALSQVGDRISVLAVAQPVGVGEQITTEDLVVAQVSTDPALQPVLAIARDSVIGQQAAVALTPGSLLTLDQVTAQVIPGPGEQLVPVTIPGGRLPTQPLVPGDTVLVVPTPQVNGDAPEVVPDAITATVVAIGGTDRNGLVTLDLVVENGDGIELAAQAATTRIALVLQPRGKS